LAALVASMAPSAAMAIGGASGAKVDYQVQGQIGEIIVNPYDIAPLTAIIKNGGYLIKDATVRIVPKKDGQEIKYNVAPKHLLTHGGIPVFGLYPDHVNTVEVEYSKLNSGKWDRVNESYTIYAAPVYSEPNATKTLKAAFFSSANVKKVDSEFSDRLYFVNNFMHKAGKGTRVVWNNPTGGALEWKFYHRHQRRYPLVHERKSHLRPEVHLQRRRHDGIQTERRRRHDLGFRPALCKV